MHLFSSHFALLSFLSLFPTTIPAQASLTRFLSIYTTALPSPGVLTQIPTTSFTNPSKAGFWIYVPKNLAPKPALLVAIHYCTGTAEAYFKNSPYGNLAEKYGYIVVYPSSPNSGTCWDVSSAASLSNGEKGDSGSIVGMVKWTLRNHATIDASKVFVLGTSSGAMMTNILAAAYPNIFTAAIVYAGVPAGCMASLNPLSVNSWNSTCAQGKSRTTSSRWAEVAKNMGPPNYNGPRPKMLIYHGGKDATVNPVNFDEQVKQWCGIFGYAYENPVMRRDGAPAVGQVMTVWGERLKGVFGREEPHNLKYWPEVDMEWLGFK